MSEVMKELQPYKGKFFDGEWPTITEMFNIALSKYADRPCFTVFEKKEKICLTYKDVHERIKNVASYLSAQGVKKGDKVVLTGKNSIQWGISYFAINYAGAVVVPIDAQLPVERMLKLAEFADSVFLITDGEVFSKIPSDNAWHNGLLGRLTLTGSQEGITGVMDVKAEKLIDYVKISENDLAAILFTSGTTGNEKGAMLTNRNIISDTYLVADGMGVDETDVLYALLPLHHSYCCTTVLLETVKHGASCLFGHGIVVSLMINDLKRGGVTVFMGIPLLYNKLLNGIMNKIKAQGKLTYALVSTLMWINGFFKKYFHCAPLKGFFNKKILSNLGLDKSKILICGAGPLSPKVFKQYQQLGLDFLQGYGLTETAPVLTLNPIKHFKLDSVGRVLGQMDIIIADADSSGVGEIRVKGPNVTPGYYKDEENTKALFDENGYLKTGDLGYMDSEKYVYLKGRAKNLIVTEGGKNVYPEEIEDAFQTYTNVEQILVRGFQQKKDVPCECIEAVIYPSPDYYKAKGFTPEQIKADIEATVKTVNQNLMIYKKIEKITIIDKPMDMTTTKKIKRNTVAK
ncbi:MAG: AMP-binding protein [Bullifex sp.]|nr:AMP-binding protein [Spirochaetales bacterium]MDD7536134.1 AMP-binding protein [Spirochaetales bacterium]MDY5777318.1 AMP-binding protein [Bullifex sp.]